MKDLVDSTDNDSAVQHSLEQLTEELSILNKKLGELTAVVVKLEKQNTHLNDNLSVEMLRNALLSSENEELKDRVDQLLSTQRMLIRDMERLQLAKWYRKMLGK